MSEQNVLTPAEISRLERKYKLWKRLHPDLSGPLNRCQMCGEKSGRTVVGGFTCPPMLLVKHTDGSFRVVSQAEKYSLVIDSRYTKILPCMEWVKYV